MVPLALYNGKIYLSGSTKGANQARPPPFHPALQALVSSRDARVKPTGRVQSNGPAELVSLLEQRDWLGKLPERREKNLWWKWWHEEISKIQVPTEIEVIEQTSSPEPLNVTGSGSTNLVATVKQYGLPILKTQGTGLNHRVERLVRSRATPNPPKRSSERIQETPTTNSTPAPLTVSQQNRFYRRRYRDILSRMPFLSFKPTLDPPQKATSSISNLSAEQSDTVTTLNAVPGKYSVRLSPLAATRGKPRNRATLSVMSEEDRQWVQQAQEGPQQVHLERKNT
ncbi:hypothetical protein FRC12_000336 [Ceratobasidium sp. 428]|nr:hypothetical protein FRC12_000336 [Ceratobasidium sp. 428]